MAKAKCFSTGTGRDFTAVIIVDDKMIVTTWPCTGDSVGWAPGCQAGGREFNSGLTNTQGLKIIEEEVLPL